MALQFKEHYVVLEKKFKLGILILTILMTFIFTFS